MMNKLVYFLVFLFIGTYCFAQDVEKLPAEPWEDIVEIDLQKHSQIKNWNKDILINLEGNYTIEDSLEVERAITKLDSLTEVISIKFSKSEKTNFKIVFLDTIRFKNNRSSHGSYNSNGQVSAEIYVYNLKKIQSEFRNYGDIESRIARTLVGGNFARSVYGELLRKHKKSIFNPISTAKNLGKEDMEIIKEVYSPLFFTKLETAKVKYNRIFNIIEDDKNMSRDSSLWWVRNPYSVSILPVLILLISFLFAIKKIKKIIYSKIKIEWIKFGVLCFVSLIFTGIIIIFWVSFNDFLTIPDNFIV